MVNDLHLAAGSLKIHSLSDVHVKKTHTRHTFLVYISSGRIYADLIYWKPTAYNNSSFAVKPPEGPVQTQTNKSSSEGSVDELWEETGMCAAKTIHREIFQAWSCLTKSTYFVQMDHL